MKLYALIFVAMLAGCATQQNIQRATAEVERAAIAANDFQLDVSVKGLCSSPLSAIKRAYGDDPEVLRYILGICDWSDHNIDVMTGR